MVFAVSSVTYGLLFMKMIFVQNIKQMEVLFLHL